MEETEKWVVVEQKPQLFFAYFLFESYEVVVMAL